MTLAAVAAPAFLHMCGDNWSNMHTAGEMPRRWNMVFVDGHARLVIWLDGIQRYDRKFGTLYLGPWGWNYCNPHDPVNVEAPLPETPPYRK